MSSTLHIDGGSRGNPGPAAAGIVLCREEKPVVEAGFVLGRMTNNQAEYHALLRGLSIASATCPDDDLTVFSDSELLVKQITGQYEVKNAELKKLVEEAHKLIWKFECPPQFQHVPRAGNQRADQMVNAALDARHDVIALNTPGLRLADKPETAPPPGADALPFAPPAAKPEPADASAPPAAPEISGPVVVACLQHPIADDCPAGCRGQAAWSFDHAVPAGFCVHAGAAVLPAVSALLQAPLPDDEDPADFADLTVRCPRRECQAVFRIAYAPR